MKYLFLALVAVAGFALASEPRPSFEDRTVKLVRVEAPAAPRAVSGRGGGPPPTPPPFSWNQTVVLREGASTAFAIQGFDPGYNPISVVKEVTPAIVNFTLTPASNFDFGPAVTPLSWTTNTNLITFKTNTGFADPPPSAPFGDAIPFKVHTGGVTDDVPYFLQVEIRSSLDATPLRARPLLWRSPGLVIRPGDIVRYKWSGAGTTEKDPEWKVEVAGRTGPADPLGTPLDTITLLQAYKFRPVVLGHYLTLVSPWSTAVNPPFGERRGTVSNGAIFQCAFGSENLAPVADGLLASAFVTNLADATPLDVTGVEPVATDPETGGNAGLDATDELTGYTIDYGDGTAPSGPLAAPDAHAFPGPGIYRAVCTIPDLPVPDPPDPDIPPGPDGRAEDVFVIGGTAVPAKGTGLIAAQKVAFKAVKQIPIAEAGIGVPDKDTLKMTWTGITAAQDDIIVFAYNRNYFGKMPADTDSNKVEIKLNALRKWIGFLPNAGKVTVSSSNTALKIKLSLANLDRTGDIRLGGAERTGDYTNHLVAVCIVRSSGPTDVYYMRTDNDAVADTADLLRLTLQGGSYAGSGYDPEVKVTLKSVRVP